MREAAAAPSSPSDVVVRKSLRDFDMSSLKLIGRNSWRKVSSGFCDASVLHGPTVCFTIDRRTLICGPVKSISRHLRPKGSLVRSPLPAARRTRVFSLIRNPPASRLISEGRSSSRLRPPLCALADEADGVAVDEVVPPRVVKEDTHQISNFGATAAGKLAM